MVVKAMVSKDMVVEMVIKNMLVDMVLKKMVGMTAKEMVCMTV